LQTYLEQQLIDRKAAYYNNRLGKVNKHAADGNISMQIDGLAADLQERSRWTYSCCTHTESISRLTYYTIMADALRGADTQTSTSLMYKAVF
jgi:hypothetical protein